MGEHASDFVVVDRCRMELVEEAWARQPYHAAGNLKPDAARERVKRGVQDAYRIAAREVRAAVLREQNRGNDVVACAVLVGDPMPAWSVDEILAVHFRMHKAEGALFKEALASAVEACGQILFRVPEKELARRGRLTLRVEASELEMKVEVLGKRAGPPWGKDQKEAAMAAMVALVDAPNRDTPGR